MLERIIRASIAHRWLVLLLVLGTAGFGAWNYGRLPIDAVPALTNVQVQVNTEAPGYSPLESDQRVTFLVATAMAGPAGMDRPEERRVGEVGADRGRARGEPYT